MPDHNIRDLEQVALRAADVQAGGQPILMDGLFGWLHLDAGQAIADVAVLICGALSREASDSHHSLRVMADDFAKAGYSTMRFDYAGTGDSCDFPEAADASSANWAIWQQNIQNAADALRRRTGARRLIFCGLRIGATLAALAAESRDDVAGLILLAPVLRGRSYLRQLQIESGLAQGKGGAKGGGVEFHELFFAPTTADMISEIDLRQVKLKPGLQVAIFSQTPTRPLSECIAAWTAQGLAVEGHAFDGLEPLLCSDTQGYKEPAASAGLIDWMLRAVPLQSHLAGWALNADQEALLLPGCIESPVRFGAQNRLFGILSRPEGRASDAAIIIVNTGRSPRAGNGRFGVDFARRLAAMGITALRFDFAGLGDSIGPAGEEDMRSDVFENDRGADISAAIDMLEAVGCRRFSVQGICSGAYHSLHAAVRDTRIETVLMVNLPLFLWKTGDSIDESKKRSYSLGHYKTRMLGRANWSRLLRGESDVVGILKGQLWRLAKRVRRGGGGSVGQQQDPAFARNLMTKLSRRRAKMFFLFDPDHAGAYEIQNLFGKNGVGLEAFAGVEIQMAPKLGDAVAEAGARKVVADRMIEFITAS